MAGLISLWNDSGIGLDVVIGYVGGAGGSVLGSYCISLVIFVL